MSGAPNIIKDSNKGKYAYSGYRVAFDGKHPWSFENNFTANMVNFAVDNSSPSHTDKCTNEFSVLREGDTSNFNESFGASEKSLVLIL